MGNSKVDIKENEIVRYDEQLLPILLVDRSKTSKDGPFKNIIWGTDNYEARGAGYGEFDEITVESVTGRNGSVVRPRVDKSKAEQEHRSRDKAEVFTAAWICNKQNNLVDNAWFGIEGVFNKETEEGWITSTEKITFPDKPGKTWQDYVKDTRLEMACGEAPYLVSRYNVITGEEIAVQERIGLLDRKLRVICENVDNEKEWLEWCKIAYQNIYGFEWQGDNLLIAREAMIYTFFDYFQLKFGKKPTKAQTLKIAEIVSWNLWQMDGLKGVVPGSCCDKVNKEYDLFGGETETVHKCQGCEKNDITKHNGIYCMIRDWSAKKAIRFIDLIK